MYMGNRVRLIIISAIFICLCLVAIFYTYIYKPVSNIGQINKQTVQSRPSQEKTEPRFLPDATSTATLTTTLTATNDAPPEEITEIQEDDIDGLDYLPVSYTVQAWKKRFPKLNVCSFDKGFHSKDNQIALKELLDLVVAPRKGKLSQQAQEEEQAPAFVKARRAHSAVESAINGLEVHGLDVCPDHGIEGFKRYVALAVLTRNIHRIGAILWSQDIERAQRKSRYGDPDKPAKLAA